MSATEYIGQHPLIGFSVSITHFIAGVMLRVMVIEPSDTLLRWAQLGAFVMGMAAGLFTMYGVWKTHHGKKKK